mgnify:CR=1 FL=1
MPKALSIRQKPSLSASPARSATGSSAYGVFRRYYQKRKGETLLSPTEQQQVIAIARNLGLQRAEYFDAYVEEYDFT